MPILGFRVGQHKYFHELVDWPGVFALQNYRGYDADDPEQSFKWPRDEMEDMPHRAEQ